MWLEFHQNRRYLIFQGGRSPLLEGLTIIKKSWNYGNLHYLVANTYGLNVIKIRDIWISRGGGGRRPPIRGLHVTCDAHFRTRMCYFSQKSWVKIWLGFVELFKSYHLNFSVGGGDPYLGGGGVTCDLRCPFSNLAELFQSKVMCDNLVRIGWAFQELTCPQTYFSGGRNPH